MKKNIIDYWRNSLADSQKKSPKISGDTVFSVSLPESDIKAGHIAAKTAKRLVELTRREVRQNDKDADVDNIRTANIAIAPFVLKEKFEHTHVRKRGDGLSAAPVWIPATVDMTGKLSPTKAYDLPWIERACLEPVTTTSFVVGNLDDVDSYLADKKFPETFSWNQLVESAEQFWQKITNKALFAPEFEDYEVTGGCVTLYSEKGGPAKSLIELCDRLRDNSVLETAKAETALYSLLGPDIARKPPPDPYASEQAKYHLGHMGENSLTPSQREALASALATEKGDIVAVNGPPGTGKTTLVQGILASEIVNAAIRGKEPFVALACSTNNQAVTNLIDSLGKAVEPIEGDILSQRWIPDANSLGLYFPGQTASKRVEQGKYLIAGFQGEGFPNDVENETFLENARDVFLSRSREYFANNDLTPETATDALHEHLIALNHDFEEFVHQAEKVRQTIRNLEKSGHESFDLWVEHSARELAKAGEELADIERQLDRAHKETEKNVQEALSLRRRTTDRAGAASLLELFFSFLPDIRRRRIRRAIDALETSGFGSEAERLYQPGARIEDVAIICNAIVENAKTKAPPYKLLEREKEATEKRDAADAQLKHVQDLYHQGQKSWAVLADTTNRVNQATGTCTYELRIPEKLQEKYGTCADRLIVDADRLFRHRLFLVAMRYWESRWLDAAKNLNPDLKTKQAEKIVKDRFLRYAMLTPCFVATCYKAAGVFRYYGPGKPIEGETPKAMERPLVGFFDLLIIDEAGQVAPEIGGPCFSLAKRATVIGDTQQIAPVVNLDKHVDGGNLYKYGLGDKTNEIHPKGFISRTGSAMRMAQSTTRYGVPNSETPGMFLSEHWRCVDEIIEYCNQLYDNRLLPCRGKATGNNAKAKEKSHNWLPPMAYAHIRGKSEKISGSWQNEGEAKAIADWISRNRARLEKDYAGKKIGEIVAIVTPFGRQAKTIRSELQKRNIPADRKEKGAVTVGTIHSLQGAQSPVVLFSSVYDQDDEKRYFFDRDKTMLNVAVSRAQNHFIVFGDMSIFDPNDGNSCSGKLARILFADEENELTDIEPSTLGIFCRGTPERLENTQQHRKYLKEVFNSAQKRILVYSPFLSDKALNDDNILELIDQAHRRKVKIVIASCRDHFTPYNKTEKDYARAARKILESSQAKFILLPQVHNKTLAVDDNQLIEGSFNWLSAPRNPKFEKQEFSNAYTGPDIGQTIDRVWAQTITRIEREEDRRELVSWLGWAPKHQNTRADLT